MGHKKKIIRKKILCKKINIILEDLDCNLITSLNRIKNKKSSKNYQSFRSFASMGHILALPDDLNLSQEKAEFLK